MDRGAIVVEEVSGEGAQTTHRISAPVAVPPCVAFHKWAEDVAACIIHPARLLDMAR